MGIGLALQQEIQWRGLRKVVLCWVGTPIGAMIISFILYKISQCILGKRTINNRKLLNILIGWLSTPLIAGIVAFGMMKVLNLFL